MGELVACIGVRAPDNYAITRTRARLLAGGRGGEVVGFAFAEARAFNDPVEVQQLCTRGR